MLAIFAVVEISYRFYTVGTVALNPYRANSLNTLMRSEYVQLADDSEPFFELKPSMEGWFKGVWFTTNSAGMADQEYDLQKPGDVFRVAVVGSSWTMASGVEINQSWHAVIEDRFNLENSEQKIELLNFGVELYGLREFVGAARYKALQWDPDLILVAVTTWTTSILWEEADKSQVLPDRAYPFFESYSLRALFSLLGWQIDRPADDRARLAPDEHELRIGQLKRALGELGELSRSSHVPIGVIFLGYVPLGPDVERAVLKKAAEQGITVILANEIFPIDPNESSKLQKSAFDRHPNAAGHELIADYVGVKLFSEKLLPVSP